MSIKELFFKQLDRPINGVVKADQDDDATVYQELDEYVVTNELERHFRAFFESYATRLDDPSIANRVGVWISGFFGSGKSHFLKTLSYLLANIEARTPQGQPQKAIEFFDESKVRDAMIRADLQKAANTPADVILFNIESKAGSNDAGNPILSVFLRVFNEHLGFSSDYPHIAHMERHLEQRGVYQQFRDAFEQSTGSRWEDERDGFQFYQDDVEQALATALNLSPEAAHKWFEESEQNFSVSVENFCYWVKEYLDSQGPEHRMLFLVDEVGQYIGSDTRLMLTLQTITENLGTICNGRAWIIVTSQADMDAVLGELTAAKANDFSKIAGRFKTRLSLSSSNTDEVIQKRLLRKTPDAEEQLRRLWDEKGDILRNQISFDRSGPTLKSVDNAESFIANYPFVPYHFQLVQKVFEEIRKVGATGAHLAYGERSMLDAFQMAALSVANKDLGTLVPMHSFYRAVEGFLDTAVKRTIDQAAENASLDSFDVQMLRTLFMIRYVELIKGTVNNLVTLSLEEIDTDKLALRQRIEDSLHRLEKESLITRNGEEYLFLTNEERDISRKIKATDLSANDENKELASLIYKDLLKDRNKFRYSENRTDYSIGRFLDGHSLDGRFECDLRMEILSPLNPEYSFKGEGRNLLQSNDSGGCILLRLPDDKEFFSELRTWLKTNKFIRLNDDGSQPELTRILADRGRENQERKKRLRLRLEEMLLDADVYALGQHLKPVSNSIPSRMDEFFLYLLQNTYSKLDYLRVLQDEPMREVRAVLLSDDIAQLGLELGSDDANGQAIREVEQYISLRASGNERLLVSDLVERFSKRPYGWPDGEILLLLARLAATGRITFHVGGPFVPLHECFDYLENSRRRREISVQKKRQTAEGELASARTLTKDLFSALGPQDESELHDFYLKHLNQWLTQLRAYKSKTEAGRYPGKDLITQCLRTLERILANEDSFDFFKAVNQHKNDLLDLEEDYQDLNEFYERQLHSWQLLQAALNRFDSNKLALGKDVTANKALQALRDIFASETPWGQLQRVAGLIEQVDHVNSALLDEQRGVARAQIDGFIAQLQQEIERSGIATPELSNTLLRPLQLLKAEPDTMGSIAEIFMLYTEQAREKLDEALDQLEQAIQAASRQPKVTTGSPASPGTKEEHPGPITLPPQPAPKPVVDIRTSELYNQSGLGVYMETEQDVDHFLQQLEKHLKQAIAANQRIRIR